MGKKRIKVAFVGCIFVKLCLMPILEKRYIVEETDKPDFAFFDSSSAGQVFEYDCVRILYLGENIRPDFNLFDYAIGFDYMEFGSRYLRMPLYAMPINRDRILEPALHKHERFDIGGKGLSEKKFCCFLVSNGTEANPIREKFFYKLSEYKKVDSAGGYMNNMPEQWKPTEEETWGFISNYKFQLCFENSAYPGYTTEKLIGAWAAGVVPIYWGDPKAVEIFDPESFICLNSTDEIDIDNAIEQIKRLDADDEAYIRMMKTPILNISSEEYLSRINKKLETFLFNIFEQTPKAALQRTNAKDGWGKFYERDAKRHRDMDSSKLISMIYRVQNWENFLQFVKFGLVGVSNTLISYGIYVITLFSCKGLGILPKTDYILGQILGFFISVLWSFFWNRRYVFRPEEGEQISVGRALLKTYVSYAFTGLILSPGLTILWVEILHISKLLAPIISLIITVPLNFVMNKFWAFRTKKKR